MNKLGKIAIISAMSIVTLACIGFSTYQYTRVQAYNNLINNANKSMEQENYDQAIALFNQSLQYKGDNNVRSSIRLASTLKEMKVAYDEGIKLLNDKKYQEAVEQFNKVGKENNKLYSDAQKNVDKCKQELLKESNNDNSKVEEQKQAAAQEQVGYRLYQNRRYEFSIEYPSTLQAQQLPTNGDGIRLLSPDGSTQLTVSGINNVLKHTTDSAYNELVKEHSNAAYKKQEGNWFVVSWTEGDKIVYEKRVVGNGSINSFVIKYPISKKDYYDSVISHLNSSFRTPGIDECH